MKLYMLTIPTGFYFAAILLLTVTVFPARPGHAEVIHVFLVGGQSNADGRAPGSELPGYLRTPQVDVAIFWGTAPNGSSSLTDSGYDLLQPGFSQSEGSFGPEVTFGRAMADFYATRGERVAIIKHAQGGTSLATNWISGGDATTQGDGPVYELFQEVVADGLAHIQNGFPAVGDGKETRRSSVTSTTIGLVEAKIEGMIWMQGEADSNDTTTALAYATNLSHFVADVRATYGDNLPFVIGQLSVNQTGTKGTDADRERIRAAQAAVAVALPNTALVVTDHFGLKSDRLHFDAGGQQDLGLAFAARMQALIVPEPAAAGMAVALLLVMFTVRRVAGSTDSAK